MVVLSRLVELGDPLEKVLVLTNQVSEWPLLSRWSKDKKIDIRFHVVKSLVDLKLYDRFNSIIYGRLFLNEANFFDRGLYLDVDIWPRFGLKHLWNSYTTNDVYAVPDNNSLRQTKRLVRAGYLDIENYVNAGVILFNRISDLDTDFKKMQQLIPLNFKYHDQDIINIVLNRKVISLPKIFNHMSFSYSDDAVLVHFAHSKPWYKPCFHQNSKQYISQLMIFDNSTTLKRLKLTRILRLLFEFLTK